MWPEQLIQGVLIKNNQDFFFLCNIPNYVIPTGHIKI